MSIALNEGYVGYLAQSRQREIAYFFAAFTTDSKAFGSLTASSDRTLWSSVMPVCSDRRSDRPLPAGANGGWRYSEDTNLIVCGLRKPRAPKRVKLTFSNIMTSRSSLQALRLRDRSRRGTAPNSPVGGDLGWMASCSSHGAVGSDRGPRAATACGRPSRDQLAVAVDTFDAAVRDEV